MIRNSLKKAVSVLLTGAVMFGFAGCLDFGGNKKAVIEAADTLASNMASADASKLIKNSTLSKKSDEAAALTELLSNEDSSEDEIAFYKAVEKTIEYEIDEESVSVEKDSASVNITFTIADYSKVLLDDFSSIDELTAAIKKADTTTVKFTAAFAKEDKEWIPDNVGSKKFMKLYDYRNAEFVLGLSADMIKGFIDESMSGFWLSEEKYIDTTFIEYDLYLDSAIYDYESRNEYMHIELSKDGSKIYTGPDIKIGESTYVVLRVDSDLTGLDPFECFESGKYTMDLYYNGPNGNELIISNSIDIEKTVIPSVTTTDYTGPGDELFDGEGEYFQFNDMNFRSNVLVAKWFDYDGYKLDDDVYSSDVLTIAFSLEVVPTCNTEVDYCYYYTDQDDEDAIGEALSNPVYSNTIRPMTYANGTFYDFDYEVNGEAAPGYYMFVVYEAGTSNVLMFGFCVLS